MKKLKLHLEELAVESFIPDRRRGERGTVAGREITQNCGDTSICTGASCNGSCYASCGDINCGSYYCAESWPCGGSAGTSCNAPCVNTCDGANTCNPYNTCDQTCWQGCQFSDVYPPC